MKPIAKAYALITSFAGIALGLFCVYNVVVQLQSSLELSREISQLLILFVLAYLCRCLPIYIRPDFAIDMAFISNIAIILCKGPTVAAAITAIGSIFVVIPTPGPEKKLKHILNTDPLKTAFNTANLTMSVFLGGKVFVWSGGIVGNIAFPGIILPMVLMIITIITVNSTILILLFKLNLGIPFFKSMLKNLIEFIPSVIAAAPIGYFIAMFMLQQYGTYLVILFILPLLLARFAFSMYIDAKQNYYIMLKTLTYTLEAKDEYTRGHSERVEHYAKILAQEMHMSPSQIENISVAALLHDIGKIGIEGNILRKPTALSIEERSAIEKHPQISAHILKDAKLPQPVFDMILYHHERYDGKGYPCGKSGDELSMEVCLLSIADTYDAITSARPYSGACDEQLAKELIVSEKGKQFNPKAVDAFVRAFNKEKMQIVRQDYKDRELYFV